MKYYVMSIGCDMKWYLLKVLADHSRLKSRRNDNLWKKRNFNLTNTNSVRFGLCIVSRFNSQPGFGFLINSKT